MHMNDSISLEREDCLSGDAKRPQQLSEAEVARESASVLPERALMRRKLPGQTYHVDWSLYDPQQAAADPFYIPPGHYGLP